MESIKKILFDSRDEKYKQFHSSLMPTIEQDKVIGVRMPSMRAIAKNLQKDESFSKEETRAFLSELPHDYYEENILHALLISNDKEFDKTINEVNRFCRISTTGRFATLLLRSALRVTKTNCGIMSRSGFAQTKPTRCALA